MTDRVPVETFTGPTCKGCFALRNACGHCERCDRERATGSAFPARPMATSAPDLRAALAGMVHVFHVRPDMLDLCGTEEHRALAAACHALASR